MSRTSWLLVGVLLVSALFVSVRSTAQPASGPTTTCWQDKSVSSPDCSPDRGSGGMGGGGLIHRPGPSQSQRETPPEPVARPMLPSDSEQRRALQEVRSRIAKVNFSQQITVPTAGSVRAISGSALFGLGRLSMGTEVEFTAVQAGDPGSPIATEDLRRTTVILAATLRQPLGTSDEDKRFLADQAALAMQGAPLQVRVPAVVVDQDVLLGMEKLLKTAIIRQRALPSIVSQEVKLYAQRDKLQDKVRNARSDQLDQADAAQRELNNVNKQIDQFENKANDQRGDLYDTQGDIGLQTLDVPEIPGDPDIIPAPR